MPSKGCQFLEMYILKENKNKNRRKNKIKPCISFLNSSIELNICESSWLQWISTNVFSRRYRTSFIFFKILHFPYAEWAMITFTIVFGFKKYIYFKRQTFRSRVIARREKEKFLPFVKVIIPPLGVLFSLGDKDKHLFVKAGLHFFWFSNLC